MSIPPSASWTIRKIFKLRSLVQPWIKSVVGNGLDTFLWLDNWHPLGPLFSRFGERVVYNLGRSLFSKVASIISNDSWCWPRSRNAVTKEIIEHTPTTLVPNSGQSDFVVWLLNAHGFTIKSAWDSIREVKIDVTWWKVVWFKPHIPHWAIIQWLAIHGRLATKDRLQNWGTVPNTSCVLCNASLESHLHLFFMCPYSSYIVGQLLRICGYRRGLISLDQEIGWASQHMTGNGL
ncbi:uncharacterized protein LOC131311543 [Rhododendron vialii]|uniref:uncharacterized protein LOC131311543 n=1 Tax=Rhododendron vialii TaxID=182163 RepID=UPI00265EC1A7|nr:uncharacterized protein LOC131311543 [Rhododendron vialii]